MAKESQSDFNPKKSRHMRRLADSVRWSRKQLDPFRKHDRQFKEQFLGRKYSGEAAQKSVVRNNIEKQVNILARTLVPSRPRVMISVASPSLAGQRAKFEIALNNLSQEIRLRDTIQACVFDAMFSMGICKIGLAEKSEPSLGFLHDTGQPYADPIQLDDWVQDMGAKVWERIDYAGHNFDATLAELEQMDGLMRANFDKLAKRKLNKDQEDRVSDLQGRKQQSDEIFIRDYHSFWELWLPKEELILVMANVGKDDPMAVEPLVIREYQGPEHGPYRRLGFSWVNGLTMPLSPVSTLYELHMLNNALWRKAARQAENQKTVLAAHAGSIEDAENMRTASDMQVVTVKGSPREAIDAVRFNGADGGTLQMAHTTGTLFDQDAGNLNILGGLQSESPTATQDKLLAGAAGVRVEDMKEKVTEFVGGVFEDLGWWLWSDPLIEMPITRRVAGQDVNTFFTPEDREADFYQYNIDVDPYSLQPKTPQSELSSLMSILQNLILPLRAELAQSGVVLDLPKLIDRVAELSNLDSLEDFVMFMPNVIESKGTVGSPPATSSISASSRPHGGMNNNNNDAFQMAASIFKQNDGDGGLTRSA